VRTGPLNGVLNPLTPIDSAGSPCWIAASPSNTVRLRYVAFADVTSLVRQGGAGRYFVGNVQATPAAATRAPWRR
jgi:hypothetical protein